VTGPTSGDADRPVLAALSDMFGLAGPAVEALIGIATGVLMERRDCTPGEAHMLLSDTAQRNRPTVTELAERVIADRDLR